MGQAQPTSEQLVFSSSVESLFKRALAGRLPAQALAEIRQAGIDLGKPLLPAYPRAQYWASIRVALRHVYPGVPETEALRLMGLDFMAGFEQTLIGRTLVSFLRLLGPKRMLARMTENFRTANNFMETRLTEHGPGDYSLWISETSGAPTYYQGILEASLRLTGGRSGQVEPVPDAGGACVYRIRWSAADVGR